MQAHMHTCVYLITTFINLTCTLTSLYIDIYRHRYILHAIPHSGIGAPCVNACPMSMRMSIQIYMPVCVPFPGPALP